jgi:hypothetical protein
MSRAAAQSYTAHQTIMTMLFVMATLLPALASSTTCSFVGSTLTAVQARAQSKRMLVQSHRESQERVTSIITTVIAGVTVLVSRAVGLVTHGRQELVQGGKCPDSRLQTALRVAEWAVSGF